MKIKLLLGIAAIAFMAQASVQAAPIVYSGTLTPNGPGATGNTGPFTVFDPLDTPPSAFYSFMGQAGKVLEINVRRLNPNLDPYLSLYSGLITAGTDYSLYDPFGSFDGVTFVASADDEIDVPGPFGDPLLRIILPTTGQYTIAIGGAASDCPGGVCPPAGYPFAVGVQIPEPSTIPLMIAALAGIGWIARRQRKA
jgi:hypothetical protein